jgi:hypothetical protein
MKEAGNTCKLVPLEKAGHGIFNGSYLNRSAGDNNPDATMHSGVVKTAGYYGAGPEEMTDNSSFPFEFEETAHERHLHWDGKPGKGMVQVGAAGGHGGRWRSRYQP